MSVSQEQADFISRYATEKWNALSPEEKIRRAGSVSLDDANKIFAAKNAADKHLMTLERAS